MTRRPRRRAMVLAAALALAAIASPAAAQTAADTGDFTGFADAAVVDLTAGNSGDLSDDFVVLEGRIAPSTAEVDTQQSLAFRDEEGLASYAVGADLEGALLEELSTESVLVEAFQPAPPDNAEPTEETLVEVPAEPLLTADVASADAWARDAAANPCLTDGPLSQAGAEIADLVLFPDAIDEEHDVAHLGPVVASSSTVMLTDVDGQTTAGVTSTAQSDVTQIELFGGQDADGATIGIGSPAVLAATATGSAGTGSVTFDAPVVTVNGEGLTADEPQRVPIGDPELGFIVLVELGEWTQSVANDGTSASGEATLIEVTLLQSLAEGQEFMVAELGIGTLTAEATAPTGGVDCAGDAEPLVIGVAKDGPATVAPGDTFDYTITITNELGCTLTGLEAVDVVEGPDGTEIVGTDPDADIDGLTATFTDLPDLEPGDTLTLTVTVEVPEDAEPGDSLGDEATVTGDCDGEPAVGSATLAGPDIAIVLPREEEDDPDDGDDVADRQLPRTGGGLALLGLLSLAGGAALRRH